MKPINSRAGWLLVLLALVLGLTVVLMTRGPGELEQWKAAQAARGERFAFDDVASAPTPATLAAVQQFTGLVARLQERWFEPQRLGLMVRNAPGYARVLWQEDSPGLGWRTGLGWAEVSAQIRTNEAVLAGLGAWLRDPPRGTAHDPADLMGSYSPLTRSKWRCVWWLAAAEVEALRRGALEEALPYLHAILGLTQMNEDEESLSSRMLRVWMAGECVSATWEALQAPGWDDAKLEALQRHWEQVRVLARLERTIEVERARGIRLFAYARTNYQGLGQLGLSVGLGSTNTFLHMVNESVYVPAWRRNWSKDEELSYLKYWQEVLAAVRHSGPGDGDDCSGMRPALAAIRRASPPNQARANGLRYVFGSSCFPVWDRMIGYAFDQEVLRQLTLTAIALKRHQLRHGILPERLSALVPEFLAAVPRDGMTGHDLLYERNADGTGVVYSAGENGRDEDTLGDDVTWPLPGWPRRLQTPWSDSPPTEWTFVDWPHLEVATRLAGQLNLPLCWDPKAVHELAKPICVQMEAATAFEVFEGVLGNARQVAVIGAKHRLNCVVANPYPWTWYYEDITDQPSSGEVCPLIVLDDVPFIDALRNLGRHAQINIQIDPRVTERGQPSIRLRLEDVSAEEAFKTVARDRGLVLLRSKESSIVRVTLPPEE